MREVRDCRLRVAKMHSDKTAEVPRRRQVGIDRARSIDEEGASVEIQAKPGKAIAARTKSDCVIPPQLDCLPSEADGLDDDLYAVGHPPMRLALVIAPHCHAIGRGEFGIELDGLVEKSQCLAVGLFGPPMKACHPAQKTVVGAEVFGWLALGALDLSLLQSRRDRVECACRHLILQIKDVLKPTIEAVGPQMRSRGRIN